MATKKAGARRATRRAPTARLLDARPDTADFRDRMFEPTLVDVPSEMPLARFSALGVPVLDQGEEGACTAYGLATVAHTLLRRRRPDPVTLRMSTRMLYDMARRYDEWEGEDYDGSSCRGAMKGWHRHGVCAEECWPVTPGPLHEVYTEERARAEERARRLRTAQDELAAQDWFDTTIVNESVAAAGENLVELLLDPPPVPADRRVTP